MADLTVWLTDMYHVVSFSLQVKKLIKMRGKSHPWWLLCLLERRLILATLQNARRPASDRQITDSVTALCYLARNFSYRSLSQLEHNNIYRPEDALNTKSRTECENYQISLFPLQPCSLAAGQSFTHPGRCQT